MTDTTVPTMPPAGVPQAPQGSVPAIGIPNSQDIPRLVFTAPYFETAPLAELIEPAVIEATEAALPGLVPPYVDGAANAAVQNLAVLLTGSTMTGPLYLNPVMPTQPAQAASMAYVDALLATAGIPEVPPTPAGQVWGRQTGQWTPIDLSGGTFLPLAGGVMAGQINMSGNSIINLAPVPQFPYGAAPAQWVLDQISNAALYQGTWNADTNTPNLTLSGYWQNGFSWIVVTQNPDGVVVSETIPGLTGNTVMQGDTIVYSTVQAQFGIVSSGALTLAQANALYVALMGGQMTGALLLNSNATQAMQAVPLQQVQSLIAAGLFPEPPNDGQVYGRNGLSLSWQPVVNVAGAIMTGPLQLSANATGALQAVPLQQVQSLITASTAGYLPLTGGSLTGPLSVGIAQGGTVAAQLAVGGQGISYTALGAVGSNIAWGVSAGNIFCYQNGAVIGGALLTTVGGTLTGTLTLNGNAAAALQAVPLQQVQSLLGAYLPLATGGRVTGNVSVTDTSGVVNLPVGAVAGTFMASFAAVGAQFLSVATYNDGATWRQLPGTGNNSGSLNLGAVVVAGGNGCNLYYNPPVADGAAISFQEVASFTPGQCNLSGNLAVPGNLDVNGNVISNNTIQGAQVVASGNGTFYGYAAVGQNLSVGNTITAVNMVYSYFSSGWAFAWDWEAQSPSYQLTCAVAGTVLPVVWGVNQQPSYFPVLALAILEGGGTVQANSIGGGFATWGSNWSSDRRTKTNVQPATQDALAKVNQLVVYEADHHPPGFGDVTRHFDHSWMADEVEAVCPNAVVVAPSDPEKRQALNTQYLVPILWQAVQQLAAKVASLEAKAV